MNTVGAPDVSLSVENIGGIDELSLDFASGVTVLTGENATNRTSLLQSLMAALGSENVSLKSDASRAEVSLTVADDTYTRTIERENGRVTTDGDPYFDDPELADLFAFLLESNAARRAVRQGSDLRELIMQPVDTAAIRDEIERLEAEKRRLDDELADLGDLEATLPELEEQRTDLESRIDAQRQVVEEKRAALEDMDGSIAESEQKQSELDEALTDLETARSELEEKRTRLSTERASIESLETERADLETDRDDLAEDPADRLSELETELDRLRDHKQSLDTTVSQLGQVIEFNESVVDGENGSLLQTLETDDEGGSVTDKLLTSEAAVVCWTCGSEVEESRITDTLDTLRTLRQEKVTERRECQADIDDVQAERRELEAARTERADIEQRIEDIDAEIERREAAVAELRSDISALESRIADLEATVEQHESREYEAVLERHRAVNEAEFELQSLRDDLAETDDEIERIESELERRSDLEARRESVAAELTEQRTRIDRLEADVVEIFNEEMATVLELLEYDNIERIWIERREQEVRDGRGTATEHVFTLHVVRGTSAGTAYEDSIDNLSESEREVAGLVFALAGYLVHEVYEAVPFMLLDSLEAIDAERIADLIDYLRSYAPNLVVALLDEDAAAVDDTYERIEMGTPER